MSDYEIWVGEIIQEISALGVSRSDAQGLVEAQEFSVTQSWGLGLSSVAAAKKITAGN